MKILGLVLAMVVLMGCACFADTATVNLYPGWALVAPPIAAYDTTVATNFANVLSQWTGGRNCVYGWSPSGGGSTYAPSDPTTFGGVLLGQGYLLKVKTQTTFTVTGFPDGLPDSGGNQTDMWISLPGNGTSGAWHYIGQPFNHNTNDTDLLFTNGTDVKSWADAYTAGWVNRTAYGFDQLGGFQTSYTGSQRDTELKAGYGYEIQTKVPNLALIIPALPVGP